MSKAFTDLFLSGSRELPVGEILKLYPCDESGDAQGVHDLKILQILRVLPKKRVVCVADYNGAKVLLKLFAENHKGLRERQQEQKVFTLLQAAKIRCPQLYFAAESQDKQLQAVVYEYLDSAVSAAQQWHHASAEQQQALWLRVSRLIAAMHQAGLYQDDIHLNNFLLLDDQFYVIDLGSICESGSMPLGMSESIHNFAHLIAQFNLPDRAIAMGNLQAYCDCRDLPFTKEYQHDIYMAVDKFWQRRRDKYLAKIFRDCSEISYQRTWYKQSAVKRALLHSEIARMVENPEAFMATGKRLKDGNTATVVKVEADGRSWVIKRYNVKNFWHGLRRCLRRSRAAVSWCNAHHLQMIGLATVAPLAFVEKRFGPVRMQAYFITEYVPSVELIDDLQERIVSDTELRQLTLMFRLMSAEQLSHGDLKAKNILISDDTRLLLIDLDVMRHHSRRSVWANYFEKDMQRFLKNWQGTNREKFAAMLKTEGFLQ